MTIFGKKIIGFLGVGVFLILGSAFAQETNPPTNNPPTPMPSIPASNALLPNPNNQPNLIGISNDCEPNPNQGKCCGGKAYYNVKDAKNDCCFGILLNTNVPFVGQCIVTKGSTETGDGISEEQAFPHLMAGLTKILVTIILLVGFIGILAGGVMISASGGDDSRASEGRKIIGRVVVALALLGASGVILRLINPNFFG